MKRIDPIDRATSAYAALTPDQQDVFRIWMRGYEAAKPFDFSATGSPKEPRKPGRPAGARNKPKDAPAEGAASEERAKRAADTFDKGRKLLAETESA